VVFSIGADATAAAALENRVASTPIAFSTSWVAAHELWERRWGHVFAPDNGFFSGHLPQLQLGPRVASPVTEREAAADDEVEPTARVEPTTAGEDEGGDEGSMEGETNQHTLAEADGVTRVYYMTILTVVTQLRTNLLHIYPRIFVNGQGNNGWPASGIGGVG
jgi:hypothetical protein